MRKILIFRVLLCVIGLFGVGACRRPSDVPGPGEGGEELVSIAYLKTLYNGAPMQITSELRIEGVVVSSDDQGNFYHTLVLDDGTGGIEVKLGMDQIFKQFWLHSRARVRCNGLWLGSYGGTLQLGTQSFGDYETEPLDQTEIAEHLAIDLEFHGELLPQVLTFSELSVRHISTFVAFEGVRFVEQGASWAETTEDAPSGTDRHIVDNQGNELIVRTSRYARFASRTLPAGEGRIEGVLGYFNGNYQLTVIDAQRFY